MTLNETNINNANTKEKMNQNHEVSTLPRGRAGHRLPLPTAVSDGSPQTGRAEGAQEDAVRDRA